MSVDSIINETQLNIIIDTNIPGEKPFPFTKIVLHNDVLKDTKKFSEYPFFTSWLPYPVEVLKKLDYKNQVDFFFIKDKFFEILKKTPEYNFLKIKFDEEKIFEENNKKKGSNNYSNKKKILDETEERINIKKNVMTMLTLLFPTIYPKSNNVFNSYDRIFSNTISESSSTIPFLFNLFFGIGINEPRFSYIKTPSKGICTVTEVIWLNDLYNQPEYKKIITQYETFNKWKGEETQRIDLENTYEISAFKDNNSLLSKTWEKLKNVFNTISQNDIPNQNRNIVNDLNSLKRLLNDKNGIINNAQYTDLINIKNYYNNLRNISNIQNKLIGIDVNRLLTSIDKIETNYLIKSHYLDGDIVSNQMGMGMGQNQMGMGMGQNQGYGQNQGLQNIQSKWKGYSKYMEFVNLLKIFNRQTNETSNHDLQQSIDNFISGNTGLKSIIKFDSLLNPYNSKSSPETIKIVETGINNKKSEKVPNTIYVRIDVIGGILNDENKNSINCEYNKEYLGDELKYLLNNNSKFWELNENRFFFEIKSKNIKKKSKGGYKKSNVSKLHRYTFKKHHRKRFTVKNHRK